MRARVQLLVAVVGGAVLGVGLTVVVLVAAAVPVDRAVADVRAASAAAVAGARDAWWQSWSAAGPEPAIDVNRP